MTNTKPLDLDALCAAVAVLPSPRTQFEWRRASTALRTVQREARRVRRTITAQITCGSSHRYLATWTHGETAFCYNGPSPMSDVLMIGSHRRQRLAIGDSRIADGRAFARRAREVGSIRLP